MRFITFSGLIFTSSPLVHWYKKYRLAATIADTVIGILYILLARYLVHVYNIKTDLFTFTVFAVLVQMVMDILFYLFFSSVPRGANDMLDLFKGYAKDVGFNGVLGDSILIVVGVLLSAFLNFANCIRYRKWTRVEDRYKEVPKDDGDFCWHDMRRQ